MTAPAAFDRLVAAVAAEADQAGIPGLEPLVDALRVRFGGGVAAILLYGSCLRDRTLDGIVDVYVLVDDYRSTYGASWLALANRLLPPNVFYLALPPIRAKVAVMALDQFAAGCRPAAVLPSIWGRFCQPVALVHARNPAARATVQRLLADAVATAVAEGIALDPADPWRAVLAASYRAELRAEAPGRAETIIAADPARYARLAPLARAVGGVVAGGFLRRWGARRVVGKAVNVLRLMKAAFTFDGGADYLAWKIERHTGERHTLTPWQRRHPLLALPWVAWRLYRRGVIR